ncbi:MAG: GtrA family protein [Gallionella sp.]|nr:GtrA family protein [Gallionella sp.]
MDRVQSIQQLIRYGLVGAATNLVMYAAYLLITYLGVEPKKTMTLLYVIGATIGFVGHRKWSFAHGGNATQAAIRYTIAHLSGYLLNWLILFVFVDRLGYAHQWVQGVTIFILAGFLFLVFKYFVFPKSPKAAVEKASYLQ